MTIIQSIVFDDQKRRVIVFRRDDGSFGFEEQQASDNPSKPEWTPTSDHAATRFDAVAGALIAARRHVPWLAEARIDKAGDE